MKDEYYFRKFEPFFGKWLVSKKIGEGSFGKVYEIYWDDEFGTHNRSALKLIHIPTDEALRQQINEQSSESAVRNYFARQVERIREEIIILQRCKGHSNIVSYEDHMIIEDKEKIGWDILIRMELLYPISAYLNRPQATQYDVIRMWQDISNALIFCDEQRIIHRDIKPANIMVTGNGTFKLTDFGAARKVMESQNASTRIGTEQYMAPEVLLRQKYDKRVDIYSLGCVIYFYLNQKRHAFFPPSSMEYSAADKEAAFEKRIKGEKIPKIPGIPDDINNVLLKSLSFKPGNRQSGAKELYEDVHKIILQEGKYLSQRPLMRGPDEKKEIRRTVDSRKKKSNKGVLIGVCLACVCLLTAGVIIMTELQKRETADTDAGVRKTASAPMDKENDHNEKVPTPEPVTVQANTSILTNTPVPTNTPKPTDTIRPTNTPVPTNSPQPTNTPRPMNTRRPTSTPGPTAAPEPDWTTVRPLDTARVGDVVIYGAYEQNNKSDEKEPVEWYVIKVMNKKKLLLSKKALYCMKETGNTWLFSSCRHFLNDAFFKNAFDASEKSRIILTENIDKEGTIFDTLDNEYTLLKNESYDRVFLLSDKEATSFYNDTTCLESDYDCKPSVYAKALGVRVNKEENCEWRIRDVSTDGTLWAKVPFTGGDVHVDGEANWGIRPAMWVYTGSITSDSDTVKKIQEALKDNGYSWTGEEGVLGDSTMKAIRKYQKDNKLVVCGLITDELKFSLLY